MSINKLKKILSLKVNEIKEKGTTKGNELIITGIKKPQGDKGVRYFIEGYENKEFIKMNSNSYLGLSLHPKVIEAESKASKKFGVGPGAVRFISGTYSQHRELEKNLAEFHKKEAGMLFSSAYVTSLGVLMSLATSETVFISDALNHNCIIQGMRLSRPLGKEVYAHNDMNDLDEQIKKWVGKAKRILVISDGIFSMRGDYAPLKELSKICEKYSDRFEEGVVSIIDDSHGVGGFGPTGRGTEEYTHAKIDIIIGTLGKAFGVNGGYVVSSQTIIDFLRESAPMYIYSNPITVGEAAAALEALSITDSEEGIKILNHLRAMTKRFEEGLLQNGYETIPGEHPVVPLMVRDTPKTTEIVNFLTAHGILATGLNYPVVPKGDEEIRFQINGNHTKADIDYVIKILKKFKEKKPY